MKLLLFYDHVLTKIKIKNKNNLLSVLLNEIIRKKNLIDLIGLRNNKNNEI